MSQLRNDPERTMFLRGQVAQVVGDYLVCLERYAEAREEYQQAEQIYQQISSTSADYEQAKKNQEIIGHNLQTLPCTQKSCQDYQLKFLFATDDKQLSSSTIQVAERLNQWLENLLGQGWQIIDNLVGTSEANLAYAYGFRANNLDKLEEINRELKNRGLEIPTIVFKAFQDLILGEYPLRLYLQTWWNHNPKIELEWTLLLILGIKNEEMLPIGLTLQVKDQNQTLIARSVAANQEQSYLYACVLGQWNEQFIVTLSMDKGESLTLPPLGLKNFQGT